MSFKMFGVKMKNYNFKKNAMATLAAIMMLQLAFTGCNKKKDISRL